MKADFITVWSPFFETEADDANDRIFCISRLRGVMIMVTEVDSVSIPTDVTEWETFMPIGPS